MEPNESFMNWKIHIQNKLIFIGGNVLAPNYKPNWCTVAALPCIILYCISTACTMYNEMENDWKNMLSCLCMFGSVFSGVIKLISLIVFKIDICNLINSLGDLYKEYSNKSQKLNIILKNKAKIYSTFIKIYHVSYFIAVMIIVCSPPLIYLTTGKMLFVLQYYIPGIEPFIPRGYWITLLVHTLSFLYGAVGIYAGDMIFILFSYHIYVLSKIFKNKVKELNDALDLDGNENTIVLKLLDIARFHKDFCTYSSLTENIFFWNVFFQIWNNGFSICLTLFIILCGDWPGAPAYLIYLFASMYLYCGMGTLVEYSCDEVVDYICNINWYKLTQSQKKTYQIILMRSQSPTLLTVGGIMPLSVNTGLQVTKTIYSYFMMLYQLI